MRPRLLLLAGLIAAAIVAVPAASASAKTLWLCKPGMKSNPCESSLTATIALPGGKTRTEKAKIHREAPFDCFYVYPTVTDFDGPAAPLKVTPELTSIAKFQASRFSEICHVFAPVYRQLTLKGIGGGAPPGPQDAANAYADVLAAWRDFIKHESKGRGFVLISHSQGTFMLTKLLHEEIETKASLRSRLVNAMLIGGNVTVKKGKTVGGSFDKIPACTDWEQLHCVVAYSSFGDTPPANSVFGRTTNPDLEVMCVNPAALRGGTGTLQAYVPTTPFQGSIGEQAASFTGPLPKLSTPWYRPPGTYTARCSKAGGASTLRITATGGARKLTTPLPTWGLHLADVNMALGNLVDNLRELEAHYLFLQLELRRRAAAH